VLSRAGNLLARLIAAIRGEDYKSPLLESMGAGVYAKKIEAPRTQYDWLSVDEAVVDAYRADPLCGVPFSAGGYAALTELTGRIATAKNAALVPGELPVLFIAGALDPVGEQGKGVEKAAQLLRNAGLEHLDLILYEGMRHEILNEPEKHMVYHDVAQWVLERLDIEEVAR
jgi:alpha-beta hydrolase superfamily lysophospholipase